MAASLLTKQEEHTQLVSTLSDCVSPVESVKKRERFLMIGSSGREGQKLNDMRRKYQDVEDQSQIRAALDSF